MLGSMCEMNLTLVSVSAAAALSLSLSVECGRLCSLEPDSQVHRLDSSRPSWRGDAAQ